MILDEAIKHYKKMAEEKRNEGKLLYQSETASIECLTCAEKYEQLAEWLKDYKKMKEQKQKTGHWIWDEKSEVYRCSRCNHFPWRVDTSYQDEIFEDLTRTNAYNICTANNRYKNAKSVSVNS